MATKTKRRNLNRRRRTQKGGSGSGHIYTIPIRLLYDSIYNLCNELLDLRSKCNTMCIQKQCSTRADPLVCGQTQTMAYYNKVYEKANFCHTQLVLMTDPLERQCQGKSPSAKCICGTFLKKYKELERHIADIQFFLSNYHVDTPVKRYVQAVKYAAQTMQDMLNNFDMITHIRSVPPEFQRLSINDIMQTSEFKDALRASVAARPVSAPSRLEVTATKTVTAPEERRSMSSKTSFAPKTIVRKYLAPENTHLFDSYTRIE
jgi:hypothetical protein